MLLSIDRVLQLLSEGKSVEKISELASCDTESVLEIIREARNLLARHEKPAGRKKIIIKKKQQEHRDSSGDEDIKKLLMGAELSAVPMTSQLTFYAAGECVDKAKNAGIGIIINDREDRQVGKVSAYIGKSDKNSAIYTALIRALKIAEYFNTEDVRLRTNSETIVKHLNGDISIDSEKVNRQRDEAKALIKKFKECRIEAISKNQNDKAVYLAIKSVTQMNE
jgi:ribonuclease HI